MRAYVCVCEDARKSHPLSIGETLSLIRVHVLFDAVCDVMSRVAYVTLKRSAKQAEIFFLLEDPEKLYILSLLPSTAFNA